MSDGLDRRGSGWLTAAMIGVVLLLAAALAVRGLKGESPLAPTDRPREVDALREPMQFLGPGASMRIAELGPRITAENQTAWRAAYRAPFDLRDCPEAAEWFVTLPGQRLERLLGDLRRGTPDEALAALCLIFQVARKTDWKPGLLARTQHADKLASLLQDWLRTWGERAAGDATLSEPAMAAVLLYGRLMKAVSEPRPIGRDSQAYDRAVAFLGSVLLDSQGQPSALGRALRQRHPTAIATFEARRDALDGFDATARQVFPELTGVCP